MIMMKAYIKDQLLSQHHQIPYLIKGFSEVFLIKRHQPEKWSIKENIAHLGRYQEIFLNRINLILKTENPQFGRYKAEKDSDFQKWLDLNQEEILERLKRDRRKINELIFSLKNAQLQRKGTHPKFGTMDIVKWIEFFLLHESHHFYTIFRMAQEFK